eukprot:4577465-Prymnesium_polylepis.1
MAAGPSRASSHRHDEELTARRPRGPRAALRSQVRSMARGVLQAPSDAPKCAPRRTKRRSN